MTTLQQAFLDGSVAWTAATGDVEHLDLRRAILANASHEGTVFLHVDFSGSTFQGVYFTECSFVGCTFDGTAFEACQLDGCLFEGCRGTKLDFVGGLFKRVSMRDIRVSRLFCWDHQSVGTTIKHSDVAEIKFLESPMVNFELISSQVGGISCERSRLGRLGLSKIRNLDFSARASVGAVSMEDVICSEFEVAENESFALSLVNSHILMTRLEEARVVIYARNAFLAGVDLSCVDLKRSVLWQTSLVDSKWPPQIGRTSWLGRYVPSETLLAHPVDDVSGIPDSLRRAIFREQSLLELEERGKTSLSLLLLNRFVGTTTGHAGSPIRLIITAFIAACGLSAVETGVRITNYSSLSAIRSQVGWEIKAFFSNTLDVFSLIVGIGDRDAMNMWGAVEVGASVMSVVFIGLFVTVLIKFLFRQF